MPVVVQAGLFIMILPLKPDSITGYITTSFYSNIKKFSVRANLPVLDGW